MNGTLVINSPRPAVVDLSKLKTNNAPYETERSPGPLS